jgi:hypothetical protein
MNVNNSTHLFGHFFFKIEDVIGRAEVSVFTG